MLSWKKFISLTPTRQGRKC